jgi:PAS domain-containing protein
LGIEAAMKDVLTVTDREGKVRVINTAAQTITGWPPDPATDRPRAKVFQIDTRTRAPAKRARMRFSTRRNVINWPKRPAASGQHPDAA